MNLNEKLLEAIGTNCEHDSYCDDKECQLDGRIVCKIDQLKANECEAIAVEFAKGFDEWKFKNVLMKYNNNSFKVTTSSGLDYNETYNLDELITLYKQSLQ